MAVVDPTAPNEPMVSDINNSLILVSGPARSGKSRWAEHLLQNHPDVTYIATAAARPADLEWKKRLEAHRQRRPEHWTVAESGAELVEVIETLSPGQSVLIDAVTSSRCTVVLVIEETGWGVVPPTRVGGLFRDRLGALAQQFDRVADAAWLVLQGRALDLHALGRVVP